MEFQGISKNLKELKKKRNFKELKVPCHVVNSSFKEFKGI